MSIKDFVKALQENSTSFETAAKSFAEVGKLLSTFEETDMNLKTKSKLKEVLLSLIKETTGAEVKASLKYVDCEEVKALGLDLKDALQIIDSNQEVAEYVSVATWDFIKTFFEASIEVCEELYQDNHHD